MRIASGTTGDATVLSRVGGCATKHKAFTGSVVGLPFDSVARRCWDATNNQRSPVTSTCIKSHPVLHCACHCVGQRRQTEALKLWFSPLKWGSCPTHGEPSLEGFFIGSSGSQTKVCCEASGTQNPAESDWTQVDRSKGRRNCVERLRGNLPKSSRHE